MVKFISPAVVLAAGFLLMPGESAAVQRYSELTKKPCLYCHVSMINKLRLTDAGKYYFRHRTFEGYQPPPPVIH